MGIAYLYVLVSPRLCRISAKKACLSFLIVQLQHPSSTPLISSACNACSFLVCSTYKFDSICNILSLRALLVDQLSAFNASHRVHNKPYDHRLHNGISQSDSTESHYLRQGSSSFRCLCSGLFSPLQLYTC